MAMTIDSASLGGQIQISDTLNFSKAKQKFSFGKQERFPSVKRSNNNDSIGYDLPTTKSKRSAGFGIGNRFQTPKKDRSTSPDPGAYDLKGDFNTWRPGTSMSKGHSFGISRDYYQKVYLPESTVVPTSMSFTPGPGTYTVLNNTVGKEGKHWNFQGRTPDIRDPSYGMIKENHPGPGTYGTSGNEINKYGKYNLSTIQNTRAANWSPSTKTRFKQPNKTQLQNPGPGTYEPLMVQLSTFKNQGSIRMVKDTKPSAETNYQSDTPGPGSYVAPSDFGHLDFGNRSPRNRMNTSHFGGSNFGDSRPNSQLSSIKRSQINGQNRPTFNNTNAQLKEQLQQIQMAASKPQNSAQMPVFKNRRNTNRSQLNRTYGPMVLQKPVTQTNKMLKRNHFVDSGVPTMNLTQIQKFDAEYLSRNGRMSKQSRTAKFRTPCNERSPRNNYNNQLDRDLMSQTMQYL